MPHFFGIILSMFSVMSMQLILVSVMPVISLELGGASLYSWVFSGYMIASLVTIPLFSKLADTYGRRRFYLFSICVFIGGSVIGAFSASMEQLILARLVQGAAAGILTPVTMAMVAGMFPPERRGRMIGYFSLVQLAANIASPLLGEAITHYLNWHWVFYLSILLLLAALLIFLIAGPLAEPRAGGETPDFLGGLLFGALSALIVYVCNEFSPERLQGGLLPLFILLVPLTAMALYLVERRAKSPVLRAEFFRVRVLRRAILSALLSGAVMYGFVNLLPILAGLVVRDMALGSSVVLLTFMVGITGGILLCSRLWAKFAALTLVLWILMAAGVLLVMLCLVFASYRLLLLCNFLSGMALGGIVSMVMISSQNSVSDRERTVLSGLVQLGRYFGAAVGVPLMIALIPNVNAVEGPGDFLGAFGVILAVCALGMVNERA